MAEEAAISFFLDNVTKLIAHHIHLIGGVEGEVNSLKKDLEVLKALIEDASAKKNKDQALKVLISQVKDAIFEAEDAIDKFVIQAAVKKNQSFFKRKTDGSFKTLGIAKEVETIRAQIKSLRTEHGVHRSAEHTTERGADSSREEKKEPLVRRDNIVGLEDETDKLIGYLMEEKKELDVISIIGLPGLGKTTIAGKIFRDTKVQYEFPTRIWVFVSQDYKRKDVFLFILQNFTTITDDMRRKTDMEISLILSDYLREGRFLIVLDDVWTAEAWFDLHDAFPKSNKLGKILITSRHEKVARRANQNREPHKLRLLNIEESLLLLSLEVFGKPIYPSDNLKGHGRLIVNQCDRLPLAIVVIAGILVEKTSVGDMKATEKQWIEVSDRVKHYLQEDPGKRMEKIISLSYDNLPNHLRPCFLYFGMFPGDSEIQVQKLILMWIAEGFIQKKDIRLEETAQDYLEELISRNLIMGDKKSLDGRIKSCRIHDMLREFCKNESGNDREKLFQEIKMSNDEGIFIPSISEVQNYRRLSIHSHFLRFISSKLYGPRVRTLFSKEEITLPLKNISSIPAAFKLLRVLDIKSVKFTKFPNDLTDLVLLRYIALSSDFKVLPKSITKIWNLQTLIVDTTSRTLEINADLWNMINLRHLKTNASAILPKAPEVTSTQSGSVELQTLGMISIQNCTEDVFGRACNLKKLGIRGQIAAMARGRGLERLRRLRKLKLFNDVFGSTSEAPVHQLPPADAFPPNLKSLTLSATNLEWNQMSTLCGLNCLEVLKLKDRAFVGQSWNASGTCFLKLEVLYIERTDLVHWEASSQEFPLLGSLVLRNCEKLQEIPLDLHKSLNSLDLKRCKFAVNSAREIERKKQEQAHENAEMSGFKLSIAPGDE